MSLLIGQDDVWGVKIDGEWFDVLSTEKPEISSFAIDSFEIVDNSVVEKIRVLYIGGPGFRFETAIDMRTSKPMPRESYLDEHHADQAHGIEVSITGPCSSIQALRQLI